MSAEQFVTANESALRLVYFQAILGLAAVWAFVAPSGADRVDRCLSRFAGLYLATRSGSAPACRLAPIRTDGTAR